MARPHVHVNVAMTADGKIDTIAREGVQISSGADNTRVDRLRADMDAILVGGRTLLDQDPRLTVKTLALREERRERGAAGKPGQGRDHLGCTGAQREPFYDQRAGQTPDLYHLTHPPGKNR